MNWLVFLGIFIVVGHGSAEEGKRIGRIKDDSNFYKLCYAQYLEIYLNGTSSNQSLTIFPSKQVAVLKTLEDILTLATLKIGIYQYFALSSIKSNIANEDFYKIIQATAIQEKRETGYIPNFVKGMLRTFCENEGAPGVTLERINTTHVSVSQIVLLGEKKVYWNLPVKILTGEGTQFWVWLEEDGKPKVFEHWESSSWIFVDSGYLFPVMFSSSLQEKLEAQLTQNYSVFSEAQRDKLLMDYFAFALGENDIGIQPFLNLTRYMSLERSPKVWKTFLDSPPLNFLSSHPDFHIVENYYNTLLDTALSSIMERNESENSTLEMLSSILEEKNKNETGMDLKGLLLRWGILMNSPFSLEMGKKVLKEWRQQGEPKIPREVFNLLVKSAGEEDFSSLYDVEKRWEKEEEKERKLATLLENSNDSKLYLRLLQEALKNPPVFPFKSYTPFRQFKIVYPFREEKRKLLLSFLDDNSELIPEKKIGESLKSFWITTPQQLEEILQFLSKHSEKLVNGKEAIERRVKNKAKGTIHLVEQIGKDMLSWTINQKY